MPTSPPGVSAPAPVACPHCGTRMNRHAEKLVFQGPDPAGRDFEGDGAIDEFHTCPNCRFVLQRRSS